MNQRVATILAAALCAFSAATAAVAATAPHASRTPGHPPRIVQPAPTAEHPSPAPPPSSSRRILSVYRGPVPMRELLEAEAWWNRAGANVELTVATSPARADVVITPYRPLPGDVVGVTEVPCDAPCRPEGQETITLSPRGDYSRLLTEVHELGHAMGLVHSHTSSCSVMAPVAGVHCADGALPADIPEVDRRALIAVWGAAPGAAQDRGRRGGPATRSRSGVRLP